MSVLIHSKLGCPYCENAKVLLFSQSIPYKEIVYDPKDRDYQKKKDTLTAKTFHSTFPQVFIGNKFIGGYTELLHEYKAGNLARLTRH